MYTQLNRMLLDNVFAADGQPIGNYIAVPIGYNESLTGLVLETAVRTGRNKNDVIAEITFVLGNFVKSLAQPAPATYQ